MLRKESSFRAMCVVLFPIALFAGCFCNSSRNWVVVNYISPVLWACFIWGVGEFSVINSASVMFDLQTVFSQYGHCTPPGLCAMCVSMLGGKESPLSSFSRIAHCARRICFSRHHPMFLHVSISQFVFRWIHWAPPPARGVVGVMLSAFRDLLGFS